MWGIPLLAISRHASRDLSVTCLVSGLDLSRSVSVWLDFASRARPRLTRRGRLQERFTLVFKGDPFGGARRGFADLENRQRRKSFVGSNPTPSVFFGEKTQRVSVRGGPDRRSEHRLMKRAVISERGPPTLVSSGSRGPPEGRAIRRAPSEIGMGRRRAEWIRISKAGQNEQDHAAAAARSEIGMDARAAARPDSLAIWRLESI